MGIRWGEIHQGLMRAVRVVIGDIPAKFLQGGVFIGITPYQVNLLLLDGPIKPFGDGIVRRATDPGKGELSPKALKKLLSYPRGIGRSLINPQR